MKSGVRSLLKGNYNYITSVLSKSADELELICKEEGAKFQQNELEILRDTAVTCRRALIILGEAPENGRRFLGVCKGICKDAKDIFSSTPHTQILAIFQRCIESCERYLQG